MTTNMKDITGVMMIEQFRILDERGIPYRFETSTDGQKFIHIGIHTLEYNSLFGCRCGVCHDEKQLRQGCECWLNNFDWLVYLAEGNGDFYTPGKSVNGLVQRSLIMPLRLY